MENSDGEDQSGYTPPITADYIGKSLTQIMSTLKVLTEWKEQMTLQVIKNFIFQRNIAFILFFQWFVP